KCDGTTPLVQPPNDIVVCNGQLREASNDDMTGVLDQGTVTTLAMYPKQPFDFAGRTGTISFDVSNDTHGMHAAWPEIWISDLPIPAPFIHNNTVGPLPQNGLGLRLGGQGPVNQWGACPNGNNLGVNRWTLDSAVAVRNYVADDTDMTPQTVKVTRLDCVTAAPNNSGLMNHVEIRVGQNQ